MDQSILLLLIVVGAGAFMFWGQWRARRRYQKQIEDLRVGDQVVTIGGIYGTLTRLDRDAERAALEIAPGVEVSVRVRAISSRIELTGEGE
ncbi:MAG: preprotein translocase subunit YajC [Anaerolineae bacterium]